METTFTICFESPFWIGILERHDETGFWIGRHVFGAEPSHAEIWEFAKTDFARMRVTRVNPGEDSKTAEPSAQPKSIKKAQRDAKRDQARGFSSYTHEALQQQLKQLKQERHDESRAARDQRELELFQKRQQKKKEKLRGH